jgi:two-component system sensor histidine kinase KdpD
MQKLINNILTGLRILFTHAVLSYFSSVLLVSIVTALLFQYRDNLDQAHIGRVYVLVVACISAISGLRPALLGAVLSFACWDYFFVPPYYDYMIQDPLEWSLFFVLLVIVVVIGSFSSNLKKRENELISRERETAALYKAAFTVNTEVNFTNVLTTLTDQILQSTGALECAIIQAIDDKKFKVLAKSGFLEENLPEKTYDLANWVFQNSKSIGLCPPSASKKGESISWPLSVNHDQVIKNIENRDDIFLPLSVKGKVIGILYVNPVKRKSFCDSDCRILVTFSEIITTFLERNRVMEEAAHITALQESEHLKSVLFSSISHNLKNPMVSLNAILSSLLQEDVDWKPHVIREHIQVMYEDTQRLSENINNLLNLAQLQTGIWKPKLEWYDLREILNTAINQLPERERLRIQSKVPDDILLIWGDSNQLSQAVRHLVENALVYSPVGSPVIVSAQADKQSISFWIDDQGPGIPLNEREDIFQRYYQKSDNWTSGYGTGLGLAICREIIKTHHGQIIVQDSSLGGSRFLVILPIRNPGGEK